MKYRIFTFIFIFFLGFNSKAQIKEIITEVARNSKTVANPAVKKGTQLAYAGYGIPNNLSTYLSLGGLGSFFSTSSTKTGVGPVFLGYEYTLRPNAGLGLSVAYASAEVKYTGFIGIGNVTGKISGFSVLGSYIQHLLVTEVWDVYGKGSVGFNIWKGSYKTDDDKDFQNFTAPTPIAYQAMIGARYFTKADIFPFAELSYSTLKFTGNIGVGIKVK